jgi:hypothetical protein
LALLFAIFSTSSANPNVSLMWLVAIVGVGVLYMLMRIISVLEEMKDTAST